MMRPLCLVSILLCVISHAHAAPQRDYSEFRDIFKELIETNTTHSAGSCMEAAHKMGERLKAAGYLDQDLHYFGVPEHPKDGGLVAILPGTDHRKAILLLAHLDVVEARREDWTRDPFTLFEEGGYFYGRGTFDDKSMAAVWVDTLIRFKREGFHPKRTVKMALTCGEETSTEGFEGAEYLATKEPKLIEADFALNEFAWGVLDAQGKRVAMEVQIGEKTSLNYELEVTNPGGHSSRPVKSNAIYTLAAALERLSDFSFPVDLNDTTRLYLTRMADIVGGDRGRDMRTLVADSKDAPAAARLSEDSRLNSLLHTTCVATMLTAGHATNALPQRARANVNCRLLPGDTADNVRDTLQRVVSDPSVHVRVIEPLDPVVAAPPLRKDVMQPIEEVTRQFYPGIPVVPVMQAAATDAAYIAVAGIPSYGVSGMFLDPDQSNVHGLNERIRVQSLYDGRDFLYALVRRYVN